MLVQNKKTLSRALEAWQLRLASIVHVAAMAPGSEVTSASDPLCELFEELDDVAVQCGAACPQLKVLLEDIKIRGFNQHRSVEFLRRNGLVGFFLLAEQPTFPLICKTRWNSLTYHWFYGDTYEEALNQAILWADKNYNTITVTLHSAMGVRKNG